MRTTVKQNDADTAVGDSVPVDDVRQTTPIWKDLEREKIVERDSSLLEDNVHPWLPDNLVERRISREDQKEIREELKKLKKEGGYDLRSYSASVVEQLLDEIDRKEKVHPIEMKRAADRLKASQETLGELF
jgi:hypothetical protein